MKGNSKRNAATLAVLTVILADGVASSAVKASEEPSLKAVQCGTLLDMTERRVRQNVTVLVEGERITSIKNGRHTPKRADKVIDLSDEVCLPGLMDMHVHVSMSYPRLNEERPTESHAFTAYETLAALKNARRILNKGFTTIRMPGDYLPGFGGVYLRDAINRGDHIGPRMFLATYPKGYDYARKLAFEHPNYHVRRVPSDIMYESTIPGETDPEEAIRLGLEHGEDWIKVSSDIGGLKGEAIRVFSDEELAAFAKETHKRGKRITAHVSGEAGLRGVVMANFDSVEHAPYMSESLAQEMKKRGIYLVPTLSPFRQSFDIDDPLLGDVELPGEGIDLSNEMARNDKAFRYAYKIGVPIVFATDTTFNPGETRGRPIMEFSELIRLGVSHWDAIAMATVNSAKLLGEADNLGSIDPGKYADIIALSRNPLEDITAMGDVTFVMKGGQVIRDCPLNPETDGLDWC